jgi:acyl transferase domain-containing protein/NADPH:quinone reductase-like Zn-dependent oxidoreductase/NAD(P)-dependent dehydrogenase (short-subunit alcohol dehydrogenase family)/acyl carrier protein
MNDRNSTFSQGASEPIAIIGISCNLPGGNRTPEAFFQFLNKRKTGIVEIPADRWGVDVFFDPNPDAISKSVSKWGGFIDGIRAFDAKFFEISPREAQGMDPQQRLVLQGAVDAMFDAQMPIEEFSGQSTGVFLGVSQSEYRTLQEMRITNTESYAGTGFALCINANRISHRLNLNGPSYAVDTACSSSMTALDQAVLNLRGGVCDMAIVGGVNTMCHPSPYLAFSKAGMISPTGKISTFDASADGFVRGEGVGMVILKPLSRAVADANRIHAVIHETSTNQDGATTTITAPSQDAQIAMLRELFSKAGIDPGAIGYVEAHGTGTPVGDPIEAGAIGSVIGRASTDRPVFVGSSKANVGHLESGAGVVGLIKSALAVKHGIVPPNINFKTPNPNIPFDALNLQVPVAPEPFPEHEGVRFAVVNSFGFGGANACALISSPPVANNDHHPVLVAEPTLKDEGNAFPYFFPISAATEDSLRNNVVVLLKALGTKGSLAQAELSDIAAALANKRSHFKYRAVILARSLKELKFSLRCLAAGKSDAPNIITGQIKNGRKICFTFSGQGSQWWAMARGFLEHNQTFAQAVARFDSEFEPVAGWSIRDELLKDEADSRIDDTTVTQPALFAIQCGLAAVWREFGVQPEMVVGHSIGEAAASYVAGGLSLGGAAKFLSKRGLIRDQLGAHGAMAAIGMPVDDVIELLPLDEKLGIAAINGPGSTSISGDHEALRAFVEDFQMMRPDTFIRILKVDTAWHSYHLDNGEGWFRNEMDTIDWSVPELPFISTVTAKSETRFDTDYGWQNLRQPVNFKGAVETAIKMGATTFVELGPAATLAGPTKSTGLEAGATVSVLSSLQRKGSDFDAFSQAVASLFVEGHQLDWTAVTGLPDAHVDLPGYAWEHEAYWQDSEESRRLLFRRIKHPFLGQRERGNGTTWTSEINLKAYSYLKDHRMQSDVIFPAAGYIDTIIAMCREVHGDGKVIEIEDAVIHEALFFGAEDEVLFSSIYEPDRGRVKLFSKIRDADDDWVLRSDARVRVINAKAPPAHPFNVARSGIKKVDTNYVYDVDASSNYINYGDAFQTIEDLWMTRSKTFAKIVLSDGAQSTKQRHHAHPTMLDGCLQILEPRMTLKRFHRGRRPDDPVCLPIGVGRIRVFADFPDEVFVEADQISGKNETETTAGFTVRDAEGNVLMVIEGVRLRIFPGAQADVSAAEIPAHFVRQDLVELRDEPNSSPLKGAWAFLESGSEHDTGIATALAEQGAKVWRVPREELGDSLRDSLTDLFGTSIEAGKLAGIAVAWPLALPVIADGQPTEEIFAPIDACTQDMIGLGDLLDYARGGEANLPEIVILTSGAYSDVSGAETDARILSQMPMAALVRGLATETPEYKMRVIDADAANLSAPEGVATRILHPSDETELVMRGDKVLVPRLRRTDVTDFDSKLITVPKSDSMVNFHATMKKPGVIDNVGLVEIPLEPIGPEDVRVRISAVGLNFRDIMAVTGLLPEEAEPEPAWENLGLEFGAVVEVVGTDVKGFKPGDRVMGLGKRCLQRFKTVDHRALTLLPDHISLVQAATIPSAFATAHYALNHVGRMREGEKVFIHVATGGVGTAAVQLAQAAGAEIFATAGTSKKRNLLREQGVPHVMDSRSLKFADDVRRITKGTGVDILLNSLPGDYIVKGLEIMAPYGRFLEIGKRDVYEDASIGMRALRRNVSLSVLDLAAMGSERPDLLGQMFRELADKLDSNVLSPLPFTEFPVSQAGDAIRYMSQAKHVGKVVVTLEEDEFQVRRDADRPVKLSGSGTYLITGGTAGFGLSMADWVSKAGAGQIALASRSGRTDAAGDRFVKKLTERGTKVSVIALDVTDTAAVESFVKQACKGPLPLKGVLHGAAVIKDGFVNQLTPDMITDVLAPKIKGAWNFHNAFAAAGVVPDIMIGFSSISQVVGSAGQTNYIVGNAFLDALAYYRRSLGRHGAAIDWGAIADAGFVSRNAALASYLESVGLHGLTRKDTGAAMELALARNAPSFVYARADWAQVVRANPALGSSPRMTSVLQAENGSKQEVRAHLMQLEGDELIEAASDFIMDEITNVLKIEKSVIQVERPMSELGLDSLSSFELKIRIETALDYSLPVSKFLQAPSIAELSQMLAEEVNAIRRSEAAADALGTDDKEAGTGDVVDQRPRASNRQLGLLRDARSSVTSPDSQRAMEHRRKAMLAGDANLADIRKALRRLTRRHVFLTLRIADDSFMQFDGYGPTLVEGTAHDLLNIAAGEFVRVSVEQGEDATSIYVQMHQIVGDDTSCTILIKELMALLQDQKLSKTVPRRSVVAAISACSFDPESPRSQTDRAFWWYSLAESATEIPFGRRGRALRATASGRDHGTAGTVNAVLDGQPHVAEILTGLAAAVRYVTNSKGSMLVGHRLSLRSSLPSGSAIGPFEIEQPILVPADTCHPASASAFLRTLDVAGEHLAFDSYAAATEFAGQFEEWGASPFQVLFEEVSTLDDEALKETLHDIWLRACPAESGTALRLVYDQDVMDRETAQLIIVALAKSLEGAKAPERQLEDLVGE